ncbi:hypothetical protein FB45DRAFT_864181 [Roridomyces roridus]|uniref:Uncharacterized protein n=1 Tax=Roridomyces roridus TaxID=1738132 RepID=A0AAD7C5M9_9AGAR|nr:hypothetical protein FB45DRAFT_864181 [Roridomyces roridus]
MDDASPSRSFNRFDYFLLQARKSRTLGKFESPSRAVLSKVGHATGTVWARHYGRCRGIDSGCKEIASSQFFIIASQEGLAGIRMQTTLVKTASLAACHLKRKEEKILADAN